MTLNRKGLDRIANLLKTRPLGLSSIEEALDLITSTGVSARIACTVGVHERLIRLVSASDSEPSLKAVFPSREVEIELNRRGPDAWEGIFKYPWDDFCLFLSHGNNAARARIYGSCAAAIESHYLKDETIPVIGVWDLGSAMVEVLTGQTVPPAGYFSDRNELIHTAKCAAELLSKIAAESSID
jgi:hypothetical protein